MTETTNPTQMSQDELEQLAAQLVADLRSVRGRIPDLTLPHATRGRLTGPSATVPLEAIEAGFAACDANEALAKTITAADLLYDHRYASIFAELRDEVKTLSTGLDYTLRLKRYRVGDATLKIYDFARRLEKSPENAALKTQIQIMSKVIVRRRRKATPTDGQTA